MPYADRSKQAQYKNAAGVAALPRGKRNAAIRITEVNLLPRNAALKLKTTDSFTSESGAGTAPKWERRAYVLFTTCPVARASEAASYGFDAPFCLGQRQMTTNE